MDRNVHWDGGAHLGCIVQQFRMIYRRLRDEDHNLAARRVFLVTGFSPMPSGKYKPQKEEDLYEKALKLREEKLIAKDAKRKAALESRVPKPQTQEDGDGDKRAITYNISKNRGLTPHKRKELRNPRVKHRKKYEKALKSRKGQVRQYNASLQDKPYSGEANGINPYVIKSTPLQ